MPNISSLQTADTPNGDTPWCHGPMEIGRRKQRETPGEATWRKGGMWESALLLTAKAKAFPKATIYQMSTTSESTQNGEHCFFWCQVVPTQNKIYSNSHFGRNHRALQSLTSPRAMSQHLAGTQHDDRSDGTRRGVIPPKPWRIAASRRTALETKFAFHRIDR